MVNGVNAIGPNPDIGEPGFLYEIELFNREPVRLIADQSPYNNENRWVVVVDAVHLLSLLKLGPFGHEFSKGPSAYRTDTKMPSVTTIFENSSSPVPLPHAAASHLPRPLWPLSVKDAFLTLLGLKSREYGKVLTSSFTDGVTRTMWLLMNGARGFPVLGDVVTANLLHCHAGLHGFDVRNIQQLMEYGYENTDENIGC